jgi:hypothetical protein
VSYLSHRIFSTAVSYACYVASPSHLWFDRPNYVFAEQYKLWSFSFCSFLQLPVPSPLLNQNNLYPVGSDGGDAFFRNVGCHLQDHTASQPRDHTQHLYLPENLRPQSDWWSLADLPIGFRRQWIKKVPIFLLYKGKIEHTFEWHIC